MREYYDYVRKTNEGGGNLMPKPTVYITNKSVHDFSAAKAFGKLVYLSENSVDRFNTSRIYRMFYPVLRKSKKNDYILVTGLTIMNLIAAFIFALKHRRLNLLLFKTYKGKKEYIERILIGDKEEL